MSKILQRSSYAIVLTAITLCARGQSSDVHLTVTKTSSAMKIDGVLDEESWGTASSTSSFLNKWPLDAGLAKHQTLVKVLFNDGFIFIAATNYQLKNNLITQTLKRDQVDAFWGSDGFSVILDPINQHTNAFLFGVNASGAQVDGAITANGSWSELNENWDNKWFSAVTIHDDCWIAEMAIPFTALRFDSNNNTWGANFIRNDMKENAFSTWSRVPLQFNGLNLGYLGSISWGEKLTPDQGKVTLIPYVSGGLVKLHEDQTATDQLANVGMDAKVALTSSLNLDLTIKPDFSNAEVDRQVTNLTRFSLMFPERRNFFLENADLFSNFGSWNVKPFFSRKIGLHDGEPVPIFAGARLSGNATKALRVGVMDVQTQATEEFSASNYLVTALQHQVLDRSNIKVFAANRQTTSAVEGDQTLDYNRTYGTEFQFVSNDGKWSGFARGHTALTPEKLHDNNYLSTQMNFLNKKFYAGTLLESVGENYVNDFGFIPRLYNYDAERDTTIRVGHQTVNPWFGLLIYPKRSKQLNMIEPNTWSFINFGKDGKLLERNTSFNVMFQFKNTTQIYVEAFNTDVNLLFPADIIDSGKPIPGKRYRFTQYTARYTSDLRKRISGSLNAGYGEFYDGTRREYGATLNYRVQPWGFFSLSYLQNDVALAENYGRASFQLICQRTEVSLRNNVWWTTFLQYNTQENNLSINSRLQWRFKPMSDVFLVYTDNYTASDFAVRNRAVVVKFTYWLNL